jgi:hypothetical protein
MLNFPKTASSYGGDRASGKRAAVGRIVILAQGINADASYRFSPHPCTNNFGQRPRASMPPLV